MLLFLMILTRKQLYINYSVSVKSFTDKMWTGVDFEFECTIMAYKLEVE